MDNHGDDGTHAGEALFWSEVMNIDGIHHVDDQPWEYAVHKQTPEDRVLRGYIVPALIKACKRLVEVRESGGQPVTHSVLLKGEAPDHG